MALTLGEAHRRGQPHKVLHLTSYDRLERAGGGLSRNCHAGRGKKMIGGCRWVDGILISLDNWRCLWHLRTIIL